MKKLKRVLAFVLFLGLFTELFVSLNTKGTQAASKPGTPVIKLKEIEDGTGIKVKISKTSNAEGYAIYVKKPSSDEFKRVKTLKKSGKKKRSYKIKDLSAGEYEVKVKAYVKSGSKKVWSDYSSTLKIKLQGKNTDAMSNPLEYARANYPKLAELADQGLVQFTAESRDVIKLGQWEMPTSPFTREDKQDIEWLVLKYSDDGKSALVISKYILGMRAYDDKLKNATWEKSGIRKWLNGDFFKKAFSKSEQALIKEVTVKNNPNGKHGTDAGNDTKDKVFLLSEEEWFDYFKQKSNEDAAFRGLNVYISGQFDECWLRTPGEDNHRAMVSWEDGSIWYDGWDIYMEMGVRPVFWMELTDEIIESNRLSISDKYNGTESQLYMTFGSYFMEDVDGVSGDDKVPIEWKILDYDEKNGNVLLTSRFLVTKRQYDEGGKKASWESSSLRRWLNGEFYDGAFSSTEKEMIRSTNVKNDDVNTKDKVFILSMAEAFDYLDKDGDFYSPYGTVCSFIDEAGYDWWLRNTVYDSRAMVSGADGYMDDCGICGDVDRLNAVRPAINLFLDPSEAQKPVVPAIPVATIKASKDDAGIEIDIEKTDDAEGYYIYLQKESDASPVLYNTIDKDGSVKRSCSLKNLTPGKYTVSIKAYRKEKGDVITSEFGEAVKLKLSGFGEMDYVSENYPELKNLAERGIIGFDVKYGRDTIKLGSLKGLSSTNTHYSIDNSDGTKDKIEWEVLEYSEDGKSALVISKNLVASGPYNHKDTFVTWADSEVNEWLNGEFLNKAFTADELKLIQTTTVKTNDSYDGVDGGRDTDDKLFLLSVEEADKYYHENDFGCRPGIIGSFADGQIQDWFLRTPGEETADFSDWDEEDWEDFDIDEYAKCYMAYVDCYNDIYYDGQGVDRVCGIRPAFWITLTPEIIESNNLNVGYSSKKVEELYVTMGMFNGKGIDWQIVDYDKASGKALLVSRYLVTGREYDGTGKDVTWETCGLRNWLNDGFINESFSNAEKAKILSTVFKSGKGGSIETNDKVFILSLDEIDKYFHPYGAKEDINRLCGYDGGVLDEYWIRRMDDASAYSPCISYLGSVWSNTSNNADYGIRPALWLDLTF